jgi:transposase
MAGMAGFIEGVQRGQSVLFPDRLDDWVGEDDLVRVVELFVGDLDLPGLGFVRAAPAKTGRPGYHPAVVLQLFIYGYLNRIPSSRRVEREAGRNVEVMWLTGRLVSDHKTIADFRRDNGPALRKVCAGFVELCRRIGALNPAVDKRVERFGWTFAHGDKVMQIENDYDKDVYNCENGMIADVDLDEGEWWSTLDGRTVTFAFGEIDTVVPAYATTTHKSQGSE